MKRAPSYTINELIELSGAGRRTIERWLKHPTNKLRSFVAIEGGHRVRRVLVSTWERYKRPQMGGKR